MVNESSSPQNLLNRMPVPLHGAQSFGRQDQNSLGESTEGNRLREVLIRIGQRCMELTADPQTDIDPSALFFWKRKPNGKLDEKANWRQVSEPQLPQGVSIGRAVRVARSDLGHTTFIVLRSNDGGIVSVQKNEGRTRFAGEVGLGTITQEEHQEISVIALRRSELKGGIIGEIGKKYLYQMDEVIIGTTPQTTVLESTQFTDRKKYNSLMENFPYTLALGEWFAGTKEGEVQIEPSVENYEAILRVLEQGEISPKDMAKAVARGRQQNSILTEEEFNTQAEYYAGEKALREEQYRQQKGGDTNIVDSVLIEKVEQDTETVAQNIRQQLEPGL